MPLAEQRYFSLQVMLVLVVFGLSNMVTAMLAERVIERQPVGGVGRNRGGHLVKRLLSPEHHHHRPRLYLSDDHQH